MRSHGSWHDRIHGARTFEEALEKAGLSAGYEIACETAPEFADLARWAIEQQLQPVDPSSSLPPPPSGKRKRSGEETVSDFNRNTGTQGDLFPEEQIATSPDERVLCGIEAVMPVIYHDEADHPVTIRGAYNADTDELMETVVEKLGAMSIDARGAADRINWCHVGAMNLLGRKRRRRK